MTSLARMMGAAFWWSSPANRRTIPKIPIHPPRVIGQCILKSGAVTPPVRVKARRRLKNPV